MPWCLGYTCTRPEPHQTTRPPIFNLYIIIYIYIYTIFIYLMKKKRWKMTNKSLTRYIVFACFCLARKTILSSFLLHWLRGPSFPVSFDEFPSVGWDLHGISMGSPCVFLVEGSHKGSCWCIENLELLFGAAWSPWYEHLRSRFEWTIIEARQRFHLSNFMVFLQIGWNIMILLFPFCL